MKFIQAQRSKQVQCQTTLNDIVFSPSLLLLRPRPRASHRVTDAATHQMLRHSAYSTATSSIIWRNQIKQNQLISQISSILLQRKNWFILLQSLNLSSKLTPSLFLQILRKIQNHPQISLSFFNWVKSNAKFQPDLSSQCLIVQVSVGAGLVQPARTILDSLVRAYPAPLLGETMIRACRGKNSDSNTLSFVLQCYSHKGLFRECLEVYRKVRINRFAVSVQASNAILDLLLRRNEMKLAWCFYGASVRDGVVADKSTWSLIAQILYKDGKFEKIVKFLDMDVYNSVMYNAVVDCYSKNGDFGAAFDRLNEMCERKLEPGFSIYSSMLDGACKHGNDEVIGRVRSMMVEKGLIREYPLSECDSVIQRLCDLGKINAATMFFKRAGDTKISLQDATYRCMLKALSKEGRVEEAIDLYRIILEMGFTMKESTYHAFVDLLCKEDWSCEGCEILMDVMRRGFRPCISGLSKLISAKCSKRRWREAEELLNAIIEKGLLPDSSSCSTLVKRYCSTRQIDKAIVLHNKMEKSQASLDVATYNILVNRLLKEGMIEEAIKVFDYMKRLELVNSTSFTIIIRGLCHWKEMRKAMKLHDEMLKMDLKPDKATYKRLILGFK